MYKNAKIEKILVCPKCQSKLSDEKGYLKCRQCHKHYIKENNKIFFLSKKEIQQITNKQDWLGRLKDRIKNNVFLYYWLVIIFSPVISLGIKKWQRLSKSLHRQANILNLGSGPHGIDEKIINIDISPYKNVDIVADISKLPFRKNSIDAVLSIAVLEHLSNPEKVVAEMHRVLAPGGFAYCIVPFMYGFHSSPNDFSRWTEPGVRILFGQFRSCEIGIASGPSSALIAMAAEFLACLFSFNILFLYKFFWILFTIILFPIKYLDLLLNQYGYSKNIACTFYLIARK